MGTGGDNNTFSNSSVKKCGLVEHVVFIIAIVCGTACSICSKTMMQLKGVGINGDVETFEKPIFQTFGMFIGMIAGLVMHEIVLVFKIPFPGYDHYYYDDNDDDSSEDGSDFELSPKNKKNKIPTETDRLLPPRTSHPRKLEVIESQQPLGGDDDDDDTTIRKKNKRTTPLWMYFFLSVPSVFDLAATSLCMMGLVYLDVSIYQLLRGSGIIFVALMKQHALGDHLYKFQWIGVFWNVISVVLVGSTAILNSSDSDERHTVGESILGIVLVLAGAFVQALQFVFEEKVMTMDDDAVPPLLLIGMEGLWGTILCLVIVYPLAYLIPGNDHGSYEDPFNTWHMIANTPTIQYAFVVYFFVIFGYNLFAVLLTFLLNSVWHAILDNFRPITIWGTDMFIYYVVTPQTFGEPWTQYSYVQLIGMFVLLYGTAVYNAPNAGSVLLTGEWYHFGLDFSYEYNEIDFEEKQEIAAEIGDDDAAIAAMADAESAAAADKDNNEWEERMQNFKQKRHSSLAERSPHVSVHTQALWNLGSPKI